MNQPIKTYLAAVETALKAGNATEHTHRPALKALLEALGGADITATNEPQRIACGAPDEFAISWTREEVAGKVERLLAKRSEAEARELFRLCSTTQWNYERAKQELADGTWCERIVPILYRPFDVRWTVYDRNVAVHQRERASEHLRQTNVALIATRQQNLIGDQWTNAFFSSEPIESTSISNKTREINYVFPLWLYPSESPTDLLDTASSERLANIAPDFIEQFQAASGHAPAPEDVLAWIYAILYAPSYRTRYADFLKRDFPRIPLPPNRALFDHLVPIGRELIALHVMEQVQPRITGYPVAGSSVVDKVHYAPGEPAGRVYISPQQYFDGVPQAVWDMHIGGYRVAEKWLKDRKGRALTYDDVTHYQNVIAALARTLELQAELDAAIVAAGGWPLANHRETI